MHLNMEFLEVCGFSYGCMPYEFPMHVEVIMGLSHALYV